MIQLVIFDLDGTLLYTLEDLANAVNHALKKHHLPTHELEQYKYFVGNGIHQLLIRSTPQNIHKTPVFESIASDFLQYYSAHKFDTTRPYNDIPELLHALQEQSKMIAVASNKMHEATLPIIQYYFPNIIFNAVIGLNARRQAKPHPQMINEILETCRVANNHTIYIGDSNVDMLTARNANITSVGALWGYRTKEELTASGATYIAAQPLDVLEIIARL
ncbi:MAG: HAD family hydrolase [Bacteroidales bacterium]|nr:HAD family hydrolase [Bacteroidales bacterium]